MTYLYFLKYRRRIQSLEIIFLLFFLINSTIIPFKQRISNIFSFFNFILYPAYIRVGRGNLGTYCSHFSYSVPTKTLPFPTFAIVRERGLKVFSYFNKYEYVDWRAHNSTYECHIHQNQNAHIIVKFSHPQKDLFTT